MKPKIKRPPQRETAEGRYVETGYQKYTPPAHIRHLLDLPPDALIVLLVRVSHDNQERNGNLARKVDRDLRELAQQNRKPLHIVSGVERANQMTDRPLLLKALALVRQVESENPGKLVVLLGDTRKAFVRGHFYRYGPPTYGSYEAWADAPSPLLMGRLAEITKGVTLATILHPDARFTEVRRFETSIGPKSKGRTEFKSMVIDRVLQWHRDGESNRAIAIELQALYPKRKTCEKTVRNWVRTLPPELATV